MNSSWNLHCRVFASHHTTTKSSLYCFFLHSQLIVILFTAIPGAHSRSPLVGLLFVFLLCLHCDAYLLKFCCFAFVLAFLMIFALNALFQARQRSGEQNFFIREVLFFSFPTPNPIVCRFICLACAQLSQGNVLAVAQTPGTTPFLILGTFSRMLKTRWIKQDAEEMF